MASDVATYSDLIEASGKLERLGHMGAAMEQARLALELGQACGDAEQIAGALDRMAMIHFHQGHYPEAAQLARQALEHVRAASPGRARAYLLLGGCAAETCSLVDAENYYNRALSDAREIGDAHLLFCALHALAGNLYLPRGQFDLALTADQEAYQVALKHRRDDYLYYPLITIAWAYRLTGQGERLRETLAELKRTSRAAAIPLSYYYFLSGELAAEAGDYRPAAALCTQAFSLAEKCGEAALNVDVRIGYSRCCRFSGELPAARDWADDAVAYAARVGYGHRHGMALTERGRVLLEMADWPRAEADLRAAVSVLTPLQANSDLARANLLLAAALHAQGLPAADAAWLEAGRRIVEGGYGFLIEIERAVALPLIAHYTISADAGPRAIAAELIEHLGRVPPPPLRVTTLGSFVVSRGGRHIPKSAWQRRSDALFRLLLISPGRSLSREEVIELLWPEKTPEAASAALHQATSGLRRALEPDLPEKFPSRYILVEEGQVSLRLPQGTRIDYELFEEHYQAGEWEQALEIYQGVPFQLDLYQDWASLKREQLSRKYLQALLAAARRRLDRQNYNGCLDACYRALAEDPWQEKAVLLGMQACLALGDRLEAIRMYQQLERTLKEELDIAPNYELSQFYQTLLG